MKNFRGKTALITGASSGIGEACAKILAAHGCNLIIVARREERLKILKDELEEDCKIRVDVMSHDLSSQAGCDELMKETDKLTYPVDILINNAGFNYTGNFVEQNWKKQHEMMRLNIDAVTYLSRMYGNKMVKNGSGYMLLVSSIGGYIPCPDIAIYDASKAYVMLLGEAMAYELKRKNVKVTVLCPGATKTEFFDVAGQILNPLVKATMMSAHDTAKCGLIGLSKGKPNIIPGLINKLTAFSLRFTPRSWMTLLARRVMS